MNERPETDFQRDTRELLEKYTLQMPKIQVDVIHQYAHDLISFAAMLVACELMSLRLATPEAVTAYTEHFMRGFVERASESMFFLHEHLAQDASRAANPSSPKFNN